MDGEVRAEGLKYFLDSNVIIDAIVARHAVLRDRMAACDEDDFVTSAVVYAEIAQGSLRGKPPSLEILSAFLTDIPILPFGREAAFAYATIPFKRARYGRLIAAHALSLSVTLVTSNERDFADVPGLAVENWTE